MRHIGVILLLLVGLTGCGGSSTAARHGRRLEVTAGSRAPVVRDVRTGQVGILSATLPQTGPTHKPRKAEMQAGLAQVMRFVKAHCPCEYEPTTTGLRLLKERHP